MDGRILILSAFSAAFIVEVGVHILTKGHDHVCVNSLCFLLLYIILAYSRRVIITRSLMSV